MFMSWVSKAVAVAAIVVFSAGAALAEVKTRTITYEEGGAKLTGTLAWDDAATTPRPGILVVHEWWGLNDYAISRARQLASEGYVAFAADMYGDNKVTKHAKDASGWMKQITSNVGAWQSRALAGLNVLKSQPEVNGAKLAAIGYCFGGATVMQMAYAGMPVQAVASFHGSLPAAPDSVTSVDARVFVAHGQDDGFVPQENVLKFQKRMDEIGAKWDMAIYSGVRHSFTNPGAAEMSKINGIDNIKYDAHADRASWAAMHQILAETFGGF